MARARIPRTDIGTLYEPEPTSRSLKSYLKPNLDIDLNKI